MKIEKLIESLKICGNYHGCDGCVYQKIDNNCTDEICVEAATALEQLQAENDRLKRERDDAIRQLKFFAPCAGCKWYRGIKGCAHELGCDTNHDYYEFVAKGE